jgi:hypothetical protein
MDFIPLLRLDKQITINKIPSFLESIKGKINEGDKIYLYDQNGIEKNKPNLCIYQRLSRDYNLWVDSGPRNLGDIVDVFLTGAERTTIHEKLYPNLNLSEIREITENKIFLRIDFEQPTDHLFPKVDGVVCFENMEKVENNFKYTDYLKQIQIKNTPLYVYENNPEKIFFWKKYNIQGILTDFDKIKRLKKYEL